MAASRGVWRDRPWAGAIAFSLLAAGIGCGKVERPEGSTVDSAPDDDPDAARSPDGAPVERGQFAWQQHLYTSFPQVDLDSDGRAVVVASFTGVLDVGDGVSAGAGSNLLVARFDGESGAHQTSIGYGADGDEFMIENALDLDDNATVSGLFRGTADVGGGPIGPATDFNSYVARYNPAGQHLWSTPITGSGAAFIRGDSTNGSGLTATTGNFNPSVIVDGQELISAGGNDLFYLRLNAAGGIATFTRFGGIGSDLGLCALFDGLGRVYLVGVTDGAIDFGNGAVVETSGGRDLFVAQVTEQGQAMWAFAAGGIDDTAELVYCAVAPDGDLLVSGAFTGSMQFPGVDRIDSQGNTDIFLARVSPAGQVRWADRHGGPGNDSPRNVAVGGNGEIGVTGEFTSVASFGGGDHTSLGFLDLFAALYTADGELIWSRAAGSPGDDRGLGVAVGSDGAVLVAFAFHDDIELGGEPLTAVGDDFNGALVKYGP
jgi:hypothetical protein